MADRLWMKPSVLCDAMESLDRGGVSGRRHGRGGGAGGYDTGEGMEHAPETPDDYKSRLQIILQEGGNSIPEYRLIAATGPDHAKTFEFEMQVRRRGYARGAGASKKQAQQVAARKALELLEKNAN